MKRFAVASFVVLAAAVAFAADAAPGPGAKNAEGLTAQLVSATESYTLDPAQSGEAFRAMVKNAQNPRAAVKLPPPPAVDLVLIITNTTEKEMTLRVGGDDSQVQLKLEGKGAVTVDPLTPMTMEFRQGVPVTLGAGKQYRMKIASLASGLRGVSQYAYWTDPGAYTLTATLVYPVGETQSKVTSAALKLNVELPGEKKKE